MSSIIVLRILRTVEAYRRGDIAGFDQRTADRLLALGAAEVLEEENRTSGPLVNAPPSTLPPIRRKRKGEER